MLKKGNQHIDMQITQCVKCSCGMSMKDNEEMLACYTDPEARYPDADPDAT